MHATPLRVRESIVQHIVLGLVLALSLTSWSIAAPAPVHAAEYRTDDPQIRLQAIVSNAHLYDDHHPPFGDYNLQLFVELHRCPASPAACVVGQGTSILTTYTRAFNGGTDAPVKLYWITPRATDPTAERYDLSEDAGYPLYDGERYVLRFSMWERDVFSNVDMGSIDVELGEDNQWQLGSHSAKASSGDFGLDYEIRMTQLPNLRPTSIEHLDVPVSSDFLVCVGLINTGPEPAGPFQVTLRVDGVIPLRAGKLDAGRLGAAESGQLCAPTDPPATGGSHRWTAIVDEARRVPEMSELDNRFEQVLVTAAPSPKPGAAQADLTISAIKINGQVPDGKNDCKDGKNAVTVTVKNGGAGSAESFTVRLVTDDARGATLEQSVKHLGASQEQEVRFDNVRLKKGEHTLAATVDPSDTIVESKADNNDLKATAACTSDD